MTAEIERGLSDLAAAGRLRTLAARAGWDFSSNDFLGLAESEPMRAAVATAVARGVPVGSGGSRLLRGNHPEHEILEVEAATFFRTEAALYFATGFAANVALFATLPQRGDLVVGQANGICHGASPGAGSPTIFTSCSRRNPEVSSTRARTSSMSPSMSAAVAVPSLMMKFACLGDT